MIKYQAMRKYLLAHNLVTNEFGNAAFFARVEYVTQERRCSVETLVSFVLEGYCEGTIRLDAQDELTSQRYRLNLCYSWHDCQFDFSTGCFVISGVAKEKLKGAFKVTVRPI